ncbi:rap guanine nucleotide exchange factor 1-like [Tachypleus tridentatus]|uniref:rap guanine nucleotide exchange factor 1-like n=1 Tax=Tachypleus tridentatus TaxID=6853 RepID=UPI003FD052C8
MYNKIMSAKGEKTDFSRPRGGKLAKRARSFKEDIIGKIAQKRGPLSPGKTSRLKGKYIEGDSESEEVDKSRTGNEIEDLHSDVQDLRTALRFIQEVVEKEKTVEVLPGCANLVLETVFNIQSSLKRVLSNDHSSSLLSSFSQVYQTLANLIKWSDNALHFTNNSTTTIVSNVNEIVQQLQESVEALVQLFINRVKNKDKFNPGLTSSVQEPVTVKPDSPQRNSLPDIPLTPREREILEKTKFAELHQNSQSLECKRLLHSTSSDSILNSDSPKVKEDIPPPKPPLPSKKELNLHYLFKVGFSEPAPPIPPKKRNVNGPVTCSQVDSGDSSRSPHDVQNIWSYTSGNFSNYIASSVVRTDATSVSFPHWNSPYDFFSSTPVSKSLGSSIDSNLDYSTDDLQTLSTPKGFLFNQKNQEVSVHQLGFSHTESYRNLSTSVRSPVSTDLGKMVESCISHFSKESKQTNLIITSETGSENMSPEHPPALPIKQRMAPRTRRPSQYDNVPTCTFLLAETNGFGMISTSACSRGHSPQPVLEHQNWMDGSHDLTCPIHSTRYTPEVGDPPPLPIKKKNIMAYMQTLSYQPDEGDILCHSQFTFHAMETRLQQQNFILTQPQSSITVRVSSSEDSVISDGQSSLSSLERSFGDEERPTSPATTPPALPPKRGKTQVPIQKENSQTQLSILDTENASNKDEDEIATSTEKESEQIKSPTTSVKEIENSPLDEQEVTQYLIWKKPNEEGPEVRGGPVDAIIVQATKAGKKDFLYQEAFLTTYRTILSPMELISKLLYRFNKFIRLNDSKQRAARNVFSLLVRVADDLCVSDIDCGVFQHLLEFIYQLVSSGELTFARVLRKTVVEKCEAHRFSQQSLQILLTSLNVNTCQASLLDFKSEVLAEQMTLLDAELFQKIEIPEVLLWVKEQKEDLSPNLTSFTEHFNKMSYWVRSRILEQNDARDREKYVTRFIKILKHLRKLNNFNSYLAVLSALDSAPIRRLEWQKNITEGLKEYCALIDSSSSFRAYRQALAETEPPCIPYIGLILQDLTFVHIGNNDFLPDGNVNFSKRWQQFNILENMRRFRKAHYPFKRNEQVIAFFNRFDDYLCEESMWQISETIKPRGGKKC